MIQWENGSDPEEQATRTKLRRGNESAPTESCASVRRHYPRPDMATHMRFYVREVSNHFCVPIFVIIGCVTCWSDAALAAGGSVDPIDDHAILHKLETEGGRLLRDEKLTSGDSLRGQLHALQKEPTDEAVQGLPPAPADAPAVKDLYAATKRGTLILAGLLKNEGSDHLTVDTASGFVVTSGGVAVTNYHVIEYMANGGMVAMTGNGRIVGIKAILSASELYDIAVVQLDGEGFTPLPVAPLASVGEKVAVLSNPSGKFYSFNQGMVNRYSLASRSEELPPVVTMEISADFGRGSSGAPIVNLAGQVVGMVHHTESVYYNDDGKGNPQNLQMVFKRCVTSEQILRVLSGKPVPSPSPTPQPSPSPDSSTSR